MDVWIFFCYYRINVGAVSALELPVALIDDDGETLIGQQVQEIENSCDISLTQSKMVNLTQRAYETNFVNNSSGLCPSLGNCSEFITIMHLRKELTNYQLVKIRSNLSRTRWDGAPMSLRVMPLGDIWKVSADMKVIWWVMISSAIFKINWSSAWLSSLCSGLK